MRLARQWLSIAILIVAESVVTRAAEMKEVESISGSSALAIYTAPPELRKLGLDVVNYQIAVYRNEDGVILLFTDIDAATGQRGSPSNASPTVSVQLTSDSLHVVRSNINR